MAVQENVKIFSFGIDEYRKLSWTLSDVQTNDCNLAGYQVDQYITDNPLDLDTWYYVSVTIEDITEPSPAKVVQFFVNGILWASTEYWGLPGADYINAHKETQKTRIGAGFRDGDVPFQAFDGIIDEVRFGQHGDIDEQEWFETEYNNQNNPDIYITAQSIALDPIPFNIIYRLKRAGNLDKPDSSLLSWLIGSSGHFDAQAQSDGTISDHITRAQSLLIEQFEHKDKLKTLLGIYVKQLQYIENVISNMGSTRNLNIATGAQLDIIGERVGENRQFRNDDEYRTAIKSRIFLNSSNGEPETVIEAIRILTNATRVWYSEVQPATIFLQYQGDFLPPTNLQTQIEQIALAGVQIFISYINNLDAIFGFDGEGPLTPAQNSAGWSEEGYAPGGVELGGQFMEMIT
jgi:hypothetical protein